MKRKTIRKHRDFLTSKEDIFGACDCFVVKTKQTRIGMDSRYGLVVPKKLFKLAVSRNRVKRLLRDWITYNEDLMLDGIDYIFIARLPAIDSLCEDGRKKTQEVLKKISTLYKKNAKQSICKN